VFIIVNYDIEKKRVVKMMKYLRIHLHHIQASVFVGELSPKIYRVLCEDIQKMIDHSYDRVIIYKVKSIKSMSVQVLGTQQWIENIL